MLGFCGKAYEKKADPSKRTGLLCKYTRQN